MSSLVTDTQIVDTSDASKARWRVLQQCPGAMNIQNEGLLYFLRPSGIASPAQGREEQSLNSGFPTEETPVELPGRDRRGWS